MQPKAFSPQVALAGPGATGAVVTELTNGTIVTVNGTEFLYSIVAVTSGSPIASVVFDWNGKTKVRTEKVAPYVLCGNVGQTYKACAKGAWVLGEQTVTATVTGGDSFTVTFSVVDALGALALPTRNIVQVGPRPYFLVKAMKEFSLKTKLGTCVWVWVACGMSKFKFLTLRLGLWARK
jgi:hypothetical protein